MCIFLDEEDHRLPSRPPRAPRLPSRHRRRIASPLARSLFLPLLAFLTIASCTKRNPDLCCTTDAECAAVGFSRRAPCDLGVCVKNECTTTAGACDDDTDCSGDTPACVAGNCADCATSASCPTSAPVCDDASHDCRACVKDEECDSGACDLSGGVCIDPVHIRYAAPAGDNTQPCSRMQPCSYSQASATVDTDHPYIVLLPGVHRFMGEIDGKTAIICGHGASIGATGLALSISNGANVTMRGFQISQLDPNDSSEATLINLDHSSLSLQDMTIQVSSRFWQIFSDTDSISLTIQRTTFQGGRINIGSTDTDIDRATFLGNRALSFIGDGVAHPMHISNSLFDLAADTQLTFSTSASSYSGETAFINNNTFENGKLGCEGSQFFPIAYEENIFHNTQLLTPSTPNCTFSNNLISASLNISDVDNQIGDPQFVASTSHDYHLQSISPARDASLRSLTNHDHDGNLRPQGESNDIGAFEYQESN